MTEPAPRRKPRMPGWLSGLIFFAAVAVVVLGLIALYPDSLRTGDPVAEPEPEVTTTTLAPVSVSVPSELSGEEPVADAAEIILPSVVHLQTASGLGSGVIYSSEGLIVTAAHVVEGVDTVQVRFADGDQVIGRILGRATEVDIAVIEVDRTGLSAAEFVTEKPRVGQLAIAVGSPWGLDSTVTAGIISAVDQTNCSQSTCTAMVQTDAAINPGNSGGALVDRLGRVVGINVSIFTNSGANDGVGFAVPSDLVTAHADSIVSGEPLQTAFLGVAGDNVQGEGQAGSVVTAVTEGSAAEEAGILVDDVIIAIDGVPITSWPDLIAQIRSHQPGETVDVLLLRDGESQTLTVTLTERIEQTG